MRVRTTLAAGMALAAIPVATGLTTTASFASDTGHRGGVVLRAAAEPGETEGSFAYDPALVPDGATVAVKSVSHRGRTTSVLVVRGLLPERTYGVHLHVNPCGEAPSAAGPHFQYLVDPVTPSTDPVYANPDNEVWLDLRTDASGAGRSRSVNTWQYGSARPMSVVLHAEATQTEAGVAGMAGARVACATLVTSV